VGRVRAHLRRGALVALLWLALHAMRAPWVRLVLFWLGSVVVCLLAPVLATAALVWLVRSRRRLHNDLRLTAQVAGGACAASPQPGVLT